MIALLWMLSPEGEKATPFDSVERAMHYAVFLERTGRATFNCVETSDSLYLKNTEEYQKALNDVCAYKPKWFVGIEKNGEFIMINHYSARFTDRALCQLADLSKEFPNHKFVVKEA